MHAELMTKIEKVIGLQGLRTGLHDPKGTSYNDRLEVMTIWCAELWFHEFVRLPIIVGVFKTNKSHRTFVLRQIKADYLMIPEDDGFRFERSTPVYKGDRFIELPQDWQDPVADALRSVDLIFHDPKVYMGSGVYRYKLFIDTGHTQTELSCRYNSNPQLIKLWNVLWQTTKYLVEQYNDNELSDYTIMPWEAGYRGFSTDGNML